MAPSIEWQTSVRAEEGEPRHVVRIDEPRPLYGHLDEEFFFAWLKSLRGVDLVDVEDGKIALAIGEDASPASVKDLIALMVRYGLDLSPLRSLVVGSRLRWMHDPKAYWFAALFPTAGRTRRASARVIRPAR